MVKILKSNFILATTVLIVSLPNTASAVDFDARDTRVDLPVLSTPNNAVTPHMSADQNGHVYMVWSDNRGGSPRIYTNTLFSGAGWLPKATPINTGFPSVQGATIGDATSPRVCSDNSGHVYIVWVDDRAVKAGTGKRDIFFRYSKNFGIDWFPEFTDERIDTDNPSVGDSINPQIACDGNGNVYVAWEDDRSRAGVYEVYFRSLQVQFSKPVDFIVYYQHPDVRLNTGVEPGRFSAQTPVISTDKGGHVYVAWADNRNIPEDNVSNGIYFNVSSNHGATWRPEAARIDCAPVGFYSSFLPAISNDSSGHVYVAWLDNAGRAARGEEFAADGTFDVYFNRSSNDGITWDATWEKEKIECNGEDKRIDSPAKRVTASDVAIASNDRGVVTIVWVDNSQATEKGVSTNFNIYSNHSENSGRSFLDSTSNIRIDTGIAPGISNAIHPTAQVDNMGSVFVAWLDNRFRTIDIFFNFSVKKGKKDTWQASDIRLDYPIPSGDSINQVMAIDNLGHIYVAWQDTKSALAKDIFNIYFIGGFLDVETLLVAGQQVGVACFIATAAYGSPFERHVEILREFRDKYLLVNSPGRWFVLVYYRLSPPVAQIISEHNYLKSAVRMALLPVVGIAALILYTTTMQKIILISTIVLITGFLIFFIALSLRVRLLRRFVPRNDKPLLRLYY